MKIGVALLGLGIVGSGTYKILTEQKQEILDNYCVDISVEHVLERDIFKADALGIPRTMVSTDIMDVLNNDKINVVAEFFGGLEPARTFLIECLKRGKSVVTSNKELVCKCFGELSQAAQEGKAGLYFEASCVGGVPVIRTLTEAMQANQITSIKGIINGTTNYILSKMADEGLDFSTALKNAQELGYAEADPTDDVEGYDAAYKLSILSSLAFNKHIPLDKIYREGISGVTLDDIALGLEFGYTLKLLGIAKSSGGGDVEARVHPVFIPDDHPLANVKGSFNAVHLVGNNVGDVMLYGRGAGDLPTGSAVVSDIVFAAGKLVHRPFCFLERQAQGKFISDFKSKYYTRINVKDEAGTLSKIAGIFGSHGVSITTVLQRPEVDEAGNVPLIFITHQTNESSFKKAIECIKELDEVVEVCNIIRVEA